MPVIGADSSSLLEIASDSSLSIDPGTHMESVFRSRGDMGHQDAPIGRGRSNLCSNSVSGTSVGDENKAGFWDVGWASRTRKANSVREGTLAKYSTSDIGFGDGGDGGGDMNGLGNKSREWSFISRSSDGINFNLLLQILRLCKVFSRAISGGR